MHIIIHLFGLGRRQLFFLKVKRRMYVWESNLEILTLVWKFGQDGHHFQDIAQNDIKIYRSPVKTAVRDLSRVGLTSHLTVY